jgi:hypothetical protein
VKEKLTPVSRLDFLVHPGFQSMEHGKDRVDNPGGPHIPNKYDALLKLYVERAKTLANDQVMIAFTNILPAGFSEDGPTLDALYEIRTILGKRFIALSAKQGIFPEAEEEGLPDAISTAKRIAKARGFSINTRTPTVAYGELLGGCVDGAANHMNKKGGFRRKTQILPEFTDVSITPEWKLLRRPVVDVEFGNYNRISYPAYMRP